MVISSSKNDRNVVLCIDSMKVGRMVILNMVSVVGVLDISVWLCCIELFIVMFLC